MSGFRLLDLVRLFVPILPEIELSDEKIDFDERIMFTIGSGIIFLFGQLPIYGLVSNAGFKINDPFFNFRSIFAMEKGTLLELGLLPVVTSAFLWQLGAGLKLIKVNFNLRTDRELFQSGQKLTSLLLSIVYGVGLIYTGYFDNVIQAYNPLDSSSLPYGWYFLILLQIVSWSFVLTLLVEVFDKGYAFGSGILCFSALQVATNLIKDLISFEQITLVNSNKNEFFGILVNLIKNFKNFPYNILDSFTRLQLPNFSQFYISILSILLLIYLQNFRIELPIRSTKVRGMNNIYPIRLLYNGALPILFSFTVLTNLQIFGYFLSQVFALPLVGKWELDLFSNNLILRSGLLYFFSSYSSSLLNSLLSPLKSLIFASFIIVLSTWFANLWSNISGSSPKDISKQFKDQGISISGKRDASITKELSRIIPVAAVSGAFILSVIAITSELLGGFGKGVGMLIGISSAFGALEEFMLEYQQSGGSSQLAGAFGGQF